eukprot:202915-Amphidinium_carterae.1
MKAVTQHTLGLSDRVRFASWLRHCLVDHSKKQRTRQQEWQARAEHHCNHPCVAQQQVSVLQLHGPVCKKATGRCGARKVHIGSEEQLRKPIQDGVSTCARLDA